MMGRLPGVPARVLLVEDEALIALILEDLLEGMDCAITALAPRVPLGVNLAETGDFDLALLDVNVAGENVEPVADALAARGIPYIFATGYGAAGVPIKHRGSPVVGKPFLSEQLETAIRGVLG